MITIPLQEELAFGALSDPTRLRIIHVLTLGELCVCDLISVLRVPQSKVSRHLAYLRRCGLIEPRKEGLWMYYSLAPINTLFHQRLMETLSCAFAESEQYALDKKMLLEGKKAGQCC